jgi:hypothetical protein
MVRSRRRRGCTPWRGSATCREEWRSADGFIQQNAELESGRRGEREEKSCATRSAAELEEDRRGLDSAVTAEGLEEAAPRGAADGPGRVRLRAEQGGGGQRRYMTRMARVLSERRRLLGSAQGERKYGSSPRGNCAVFLLFEKFQNDLN